MRILIVNSVLGFGSTGRIVAKQADFLAKSGNKVCVAFGRKHVKDDDYLFETKKIGNIFDVLCHAFLSRLFGKSGVYSKWVTAKFLKWADDFSPDVLWLNNLHGYYMDVFLLFEWIKKRKNLKVYWTFHDCWPFTGHCTYFTAAKCERWKASCHDCPQTKHYPKMLFGDDSAKMFQMKKETFLDVDNLTIITPSNWLANLVRESFLGGYKIEVRKNEIDKNVFKKTKSNLREFFGIEEKTVLLSAANKWEERKGLKDCVNLIRRLDSRYAVVLVGLTKRQTRWIYKSIGYTTFSFLNKGIWRMQKGKFDGLFEKKLQKPIQNSSVVDPNVDALHEKIEEFCPNLAQKGLKTYPLVICVQRVEGPKEMAKLYSSADIFFNCTLEDNYPTVNLEAISCGCTVITYNVGGCAETIGRDSVS